MVNHHSCSSVAGWIASRDAAGEEFGLGLPGGAAVARALTEPAKRVRRDVVEAPAHQVAGVVLAVLNDGLAARTTDLAAIELPHGIAPQDVPGIDVGVVDAQRRAVEDARQNPDILDGAAFENPAEMDFALAFVLAAVVEMDDGVHFPVADQPAVQ